MGAVGVVLDTNVLVSALGFGGTPLDCLLRTFDDDVELYASEDTLDEFARVMAYDRLPFSPAERGRYLAILEREATVVEPRVDVEAVEEDPDDDAFLECAVAGDVDYLVSGDDHLLELGEFREVIVCTPATFLETL